MTNRTEYHGWIVVEEASPGHKSVVYVEWTEAGVRKRQAMDSRSDSGCAEAIEWWDNRLGRPATLEATIRGCYRVK